MRHRHPQREEARTPSRQRHTLMLKGDGVFTPGCGAVATEGQSEARRMLSHPLPIGNWGMEESVTHLQCLPKSSVLRGEGELSGYQGTEKTRRRRKAEELQGSLVTGYVVSQGAQGSETGGGETQNSMWRKHICRRSWPKGLRFSVLTMRIIGMEQLMDTKVESQVQCRHIMCSDDAKEGRSDLLGNTS